MKPKAHTIRALSALAHASTTRLKATGKILTIGLCLTGITLQSHGQGYTLSSAWSVGNGASGTHIATGDVNRGMAYNAPSNQVYVVNKGTPAI